MDISRVLTAIRRRFRPGEWASRAGAPFRSRWRFRDPQADLDKRLVYSLRRSRVPSWRQLKYLDRYLSPVERWLLRASAAGLLATIAVWGGLFYYHNRELLPVAGGVYAEGLVGSVQYVNPLYAGLNDVDNDLTRLVYSSLFRRSPLGELVPDLATGQRVSDDGKTYTVPLRSDARWHDGTPVTVDDVLFTVGAIKDPLYKSPLRASLNGVTVAPGADREVVFTLAEPYAAFIDILTFGILPAELWSQIPPESAPLAELNLKPVGSGPFRFSELAKDRSGSVKEYALVRNDAYYGAPPFVDLRFKFYGGFDEAVAALNAGDINGLGYLPSERKSELLTPKSYQFHTLSLPQITVLFFNQAAQPALADKRVRQALAYAVDRNAIVNELLAGNATVVDSPILPSSFAYHAGVKRYPFDAAAAARLLDEAGWQRTEVTEAMAAEAAANAAENGAEQTQAAKILAVGAGSWRQKNGDYLTLRLRTVDRKENDRIVQTVKGYWENLGVKANVEVLPAAQFQNQVLKPRDFDVLFYGQVLGGDPDPYVFWHSSQVGDQGYNIANFSNKEADQLLEEARQTADQGIRQEKYRRFQDIVAEEVPAVFVYAPTYTYVQGNALKGFAVTNILIPRDRFANVTDWYLKTGKRLVWGNK